VREIAGLCSPGREGKKGGSRARLSKGKREGTKKPKLKRATRIRRKKRRKKEGDTKLGGTKNLPQEWVRRKNEPPDPVGKKGKTVASLLRKKGGRGQLLISFFKGQLHGGTHDVPHGRRGRGKNGSSLEKGRQEDPRQRDPKPNRCSSAKGKKGGVNRTPSKKKRGKKKGLTKIRSKRGRPRRSGRKKNPPYSCREKKVRNARDRAGFHVKGKKKGKGGGTTSSRPEGKRGYFESAGRTRTGSPPRPRLKRKGKKVVPRQKKEKVIIDLKNWNTKRSPVARWQREEKKGEKKEKKGHAFSVKKGREGQGFSKGSEEGGGLVRSERKKKNIPISRGGKGGDSLQPGGSRLKRKGGSGFHCLKEKRGRGVFTLCVSRFKIKISISRGKKKKKRGEGSLFSD